MDAATDPRNVIDAFKGLTVETIKDRLAETAFPLHIAIENYQHDYNIGTIVRSANAFNVAGVHIVGKRHWNRRGAMATEKYLTVYQHVTVADFKVWLDAHPLAVIGIDNIAGSVPLQQAELPAAAMLIFGQEGPGLSADMQALCSYVVAIEQYGSTRSINLGVAAGIVLYEWLRRNSGKQC